MGVNVQIGQHGDLRKIRHVKKIKSTEVVNVVDI